MKNRELTLAYVKSRPVEAARALQQLPSAETAALFNELPSRTVAPLLAELLPAYAAHCFETLPSDRIVNLLRRIGAPAATAILRALDDTRRTTILQQLPASTAIACRLLLRYPEDSIGSLADVEIQSFVPETRVRDALARLKSAATDSGDFIYVVDAERRLLACIRPATLLHAVGAQTLGELPHLPVPVLPAQAAPLSVRDHDGWRSYSTLPVVDRRQRFVGALRQSELMQALADSRQPPAPTGDSLVAVTGAYWTMFASLLQTFVSILPGRRGGKTDRT